MSKELSEVFGPYSDDEEIEKDRQRGERAISTLREIQKIRKERETTLSDCYKHQDKSDKRCQSLENSEEEHLGKEISGEPLNCDSALGQQKKRPMHESSDNTLDAANPVPPFPRSLRSDSPSNETTEGRNARQAPLVELDHSRLDPHETEPEHRPPLKKLKADDPPQRESKSASEAQKERKRKIDPKIIDDSSDSDHSEYSSEGDNYGPQPWRSQAEPTSNVQFSHEAVFGDFHRSYVSSLSVDNSGSRIISASYDGTLKFWDFGSMDYRLLPFKTLEPFDSSAVRGVLFSSTGGQFLCWGSNNFAKVFDRDGNPLAQTAKGNVYIVDASKAKSHSGQICSASWFGSESSKQKHIVTAGQEGTVRIWDVDSAQASPFEDIPIMTQLHVIKLRNKQGGRAKPNALDSIRHGESLVAVGCSDRCIRIFDPRMSSMRPAQEFVDVASLSSEFTCIASSPPSCSAPLLLARSTDDSLRVLDRRRSERVLGMFSGLPNTVDETNACFLGESGTAFATGTSADRKGTSAPGVVAAFSVQTMKQVWRKEMPQSTGSIVCINWQSRIRHLLYGCGDGRISALYSTEGSQSGILKCVRGLTHREIQGLVNVFT